MTDSPQCTPFRSRLRRLLLILGVSAGTGLAQVTAPESLNAQWVQASAGAAQARHTQLDTLEQMVNAGPFREDWTSLQGYRTPAWFNDAKFGIFIHWGVFSVPAFGSEWYSRNMYKQGTPDFAHHVATYGPQSKFGYKDFIPQFRMQHFDADAWAVLFQQSGARYVIPVAEHHDGFALYNTALTPWNAVAMGPHRDLIGDLQRAVRAHGMHFGVSFHRAEHDWFFDGGRNFDSDVNDPRFAGFYGPAEKRVLESKDDAVLTRDYTFVSSEFRDDWLARTTELVEHYNPDLVYFDWWVGSPDFRATEERFATFFYNQAAQRKQPVVLFTKNDNMAEGAGTQDVERGGFSSIQPRPWQTDTSISNASWGYLEGDTFKSPQVLLDQLIDVVSKNGNLLLNIGPRADGTVPQPVQDTLLTIGKWLKVNGEAIYGTHPWNHFGEGPTQPQTGSFQDKVAPAYTAADFRFTTRDTTLYAIEMRPPSQGDALITSLAKEHGEVHEVTLLGSSQPVTWHQDTDGLHVALPSQPTTNNAIVFRITLQ